jgi:plasmid maintenance system antidote protein VapI
MSTTFHIGSIIRNELRRQGKTNGWLAKEINVNPRTVNKIFLKSVIDTHQLLQISQVLGVDFFRYYSELLTSLPMPYLGNAPIMGNEL